MRTSRTIIIVLLITGLCHGASSLESQVDVSSYFDSNPTEHLSNPQGTLGLKAKGSIKYFGSHPSTVLFGSMVGQGFIEPVFAHGSKVIIDAQAGVKQRLSRKLQATGIIETFQKLHLYDLRHSKRSSFDLHLDRAGQGSYQQQLGYTYISNQIDYGSLLMFDEYRVYLNYSRSFLTRMVGEMTLTRGLVFYDDVPARIFNQDILTLVDNELQEDQFWQLLVHLKITGKFIYGASMSFENVYSNSVVSDAQVWIARLYASGRLGDNYFLHAVFQGMNKNYKYPGVISIGSDGDPEERVQNQFHLQLERVLEDGNTLYFQYSYLKNETLVTRWFYDKNQFELGIKMNLK